MSKYSKVLKIIKFGMHITDLPRLRKQGTPHYEPNLIQEKVINDKTEQKIDLIYAPNANTFTPTCIMVHGGGLFYGNKELNTHASVAMAKRGFNVINISYPLLDTVNSLQQVQAILDVVWWIECHASQLNLNKNHVVMMGDSAGALLTLVTAIIMNSPHLKQSFTYKGTITLTAIGLLCLVARLQRHDYLFFIQHFALKNVDNIAFKALLLNPLHSLRAAPPCFVMGSEQDYLVNDTKALMVACKALNHPHTTCFFKQQRSRPLRHVFPIAFPALAQSQHVFDACARFFHQYCQD